MKKYIAAFVALLVVFSLPALAGGNKKSEVVQALTESFCNKDLMITYRLRGIVASTALGGETNKFYRGRPVDTFGGDPIPDLPGLRRLKGEKIMLSPGDAVRVRKFEAPDDKTIVIIIETVDKVTDKGKPYKARLEASAPNLFLYDIGEIEKYIKIFVDVPGATAQTR